MKQFSKYIRNVIATLLVVYISLIVLLHIPFVQRQMGGWVAGVLSDKIGARVDIGPINLGLLNRLHVDDLVIYDKEGHTVLSAARTAVNIEIWPLITHGRVTVSTAQLFGAQLHINKATPSSPLNCQFILDALKSKETSKKSNLDIHIYSLLLRHANISYDILSKAHTPGQFNPNHIAIKDLSMTAVLRTLTNDSVNADLKRLDFCEYNSGICVSKFNTSITANRHYVDIPTFLLNVNQSSIQLGYTRIKHDNYQINKKFSIRTSIVSSNIFLRDGGIFYAPLKRFSQNIILSVSQIEATDRNINFHGVYLHNKENDTYLQLSTSILNYHTNSPIVSVPTFNVHVSKKMAEELTSSLQLPEQIARISQLATPLTLNIHGNYQKNKSSANVLLCSPLGNIHTQGEYSQSGLSLLSDVKDLNLQDLLKSTDLGKTSFQLSLNNLKLKDKIYTGSIQALIDNIDYKGHKFSDLSIQAEGNGKEYLSSVNIKDPLVSLSLDAKTSTDFNKKTFEAATKLSVSNFNPNALGLTKDFAGQSFSCTLSSQTKGLSLNDITGRLTIDSLMVQTKDNTITSGPIDLTVSNEANGRDIRLKSNFINAHINGEIGMGDMAYCIQNQLAMYAPALAASYKFHPTKTAFQYELTIQESPILHHFIRADYEMPQVLKVDGFINNPLKLSSLHVHTPRFIYNGTEYNNINLTFEGNPKNFNLQTSLLRRLENSALELKVEALGEENSLHTNVYWNQASKRPSSGTIMANTRFSNYFGKTQTHLDILPSNVSLNDTLWHVEHSSLDIIGKRIQCNNVQISNADRFLKVDGTISETSSDSLEVKLNDIQVEYVLDLINFTAVGFKGRASGTANVSNIYARPQFNANLQVAHFSLEDGDLGTALIHAEWDNQVDGIRIAANIYDHDNKGKDRITQCHGYISPQQKDIQLRIDANNTNAYFLESFLGSVFDDVEGNVNGVINIIGPLYDIGIVGDVNTDLAFRLKATNVRYRISPTDTIRLRPYRFCFDNIHISDRNGNTGIVNGYVSHKNVKNFAYSFQVDMFKLLAYEEEQFNADKFMGKVYANGRLSLSGADKHPLYIEADVTPTKGSMFAYDTATPDAITTTSFITFRNPQHTSETAVKAEATDSTDNDESHFISSLHSNDEYLLYYQTNSKNEKTKDTDYTGDIFMDVDIHLNPNCAIKLRMDNSEDGYITTYGSGNLQALYHNKGAFTLNGTYAIQSGRYRLYLQDIIYRDLNIQDGSSVVFNGNPFDAGIHLICWHTLNSVPLSDLTGASSSFASNKVKVNCILDITGKLGNMNFKFDLNLPNVTEETRQLVRSLISTDEEMNMQMIYLLGVGRFYQNGQSNTANENSNSQAVNSLLSSTISGQINQMLSNVIGNTSKWNFGTGLSTGEQGWQDLDVEGILTGSLMDDRLLINGNFGYRDNSFKQGGSFIGDFDIKWRLKDSGNTYLKAYNKANDRYFTKATLNTQGVGISYQKDFETWRTLFKRKKLKVKTVSTDSISTGK